ncbi:MAG TPA: DMT family transporter [Microbacteriaceae bacterium]|nr:DMT family transporter [Microbacteriaceae bacterium]
MTGELPLDPGQFLGIPIALVGALFLSAGAQLQHRGVNRVDGASSASGGLGLGQLRMLVSRPSWVVGTLMLGLAIVFQLAALVPSTLAMVQPLGALSLVVTAIVNSRVSGVALNRLSIVAICLCIGGIGLFVSVTAVTTRNTNVSDRALDGILLILAVVVALAAALFVTLRHRFTAIYYVVGAGLLYGFVATLAKVVIARTVQHNPSWLLVLCVVGILVAVTAGAYFVQNAYASGPPDLVIAGLTVIDPIVAVTIGLVILREAAESPLWAVALYVLSGLIAICGVFLLARHHPQIHEPATPRRDP